MNTKSKYIILALAALFLPLSWANAQAVGTVSLYFNGNTNNMVGGTPQTLNLTAGQTFTLELDLTSTNSQMVDALDYWLSQFSGPTAGAFSIVPPNSSLTGPGSPRDYTGSNWPDPSSPNSQVSSTADNHGNSIDNTTPDGVPDNVINPHNAFNLGSTAPGGTDAGPGKVLVFTLQVANNANGLYDLRTFDYTNHGWSDTLHNVADQAFLHQAEIKFNVVPEPATWSFIALGGLGAFGLNLLRARRRS